MTCVITQIIITVADKKIKKKILLAIIFLKVVGCVCWCEEARFGPDAGV